MNSISLKARKRLLRLHYESGIGHIGGNLSCLDVLLCLHHKLMGQDDQSVLSKGHAAGALYVALWSVGLLSESDLATFYKDGTRLAGHPPPDGVPRVQFATGSLGHGLSLGCGLALAKKLRRVPGRIFCVLSDGEWNEGSTWEALIFAVHHHLDNLAVIVDCNGMQGFGSVREVSGIEPLEDRVRGFGAAMRTADGHSWQELCTALAPVEHKPVVVLAKTVKGNGVSFMEHKFEWHYLPMNEKHYQQAVEETEKMPVCEED